MTTEPLSQRRRAGQGTGCLVLFGLVFALIGGVALWFMFIRPMSRFLAARSWQETPAVIEASQVLESSDSDGTTYKVDVHFTYTFEGREYQSNRYNFLDAYSSGRSGKEEIVAYYSPGLRTVCWVNPENPSEAVLKKDFSASYLIGLIPLVFVLAGVGVMALGVKGGRSKKVSMATAAPIADSLGPVELKPTATPMGKFIGLTFVALFWNGIVSVFVWQAIQGWRRGEPDGCLTAFISIFVVIGLLILFGAIRQFLVLFNPRVRLTLSSGSLRIGESAYLQWNIAGSASRVQRLAMVLEGREEARYRRGTDTYTDRSVFATIPIVDTTHSFEIPAGSASFSVPEGTLPSFSATNNKIIWQLKVTCDIPGWPDSEDDYEITVRPGTGFGGASWIESR
ncbi:MAG TPA: DUF3592 domain-containing protein [Thermoanaerobaculia bacterium]|nr:DUF3592 domain-containing protein [Thermoanaerobaculia bacterium]